ncbi:MAG: DMT family transporter [Alphaproteobacteria bacterium]|nr:DMT family transporter [Alphaproteobacteria bacterium]
MSSPPSAAAGPSRSSYLVAVGYMLVAVACFGFIYAGIKWLAPDYPTVQMMFFRCAFALVPIMVFVARTGGLAQLRTRRPLGHVARTAAGVGGMACTFYAFGRLPLVDAHVLNYATPLFVTLVALLVFGEVVRLRRWTALAIGFAGILLVLQPGPALLETVSTNPAALVMLLGCVFAGLSVNMIRRLTETETTASVAFYFMLTVSAVTGIATIFAWRTPQSVEHWAMLVAMGILGGIAQLGMTAAYKRAPVSALVPYEYSSILMALGLGFWIWDEVPSPLTMLGAVIVIASGLYILQREAQLKLGRRSASAPPPPPA